MEKRRTNKSKWIWYNKNNRAYIPKRNKRRRTERKERNPRTNKKGNNTKQWVHEHNK